MGAVSIDQLWLISATLLVFCMQGGFLLIESGRVRSKNSINVAQKNVSDLIVSILCFSLFGCFFMFGLASPLFDADPISADTPSVNNLQYLYQLGFCGAAVTIFSGAVAERMQFRCFLCVVIVLSTLAYPIVGRLVWGDLFDDGNRAWLSQIGFVDFAGASVVHLFGATCGLVAAKMLGPRKGRFDEQGNVRKFIGSSPVQVLLGAMVLMVSWIGFNAGSVSVLDPRFSEIILSTIICAVGGGLAGMCVGAFLADGYYRPGHTANGIVAGLVASAAGVHLMSGVEPLVVGIIGGGIAAFGSKLILHRLKIDDPLDVFAVHGLAGIAGTLAVAFLADKSQLPTGHWFTQLSVQALGILCIVTVATVFTYLVLRLMSHFDLMKVSERAEILGLNYTEHGESLAMDSLERSVRDALDVNQGSNEVEPLSDGQPLAGIGLILTKLMEEHSESKRQLKLQRDRFLKMACMEADFFWSTDADLVLHTVTGKDEHSSLIVRLKNRHILDCFEIDIANRHKVIQCFENRLITNTFEVTICDEEIEVQKHFEVSCYPVFLDNGTFAGFSGMMKDISDRKERQRQDYLTSLSDLDTGVGNRKALDECLRIKVVSSRRYSRAFCVVSLDVTEIVSLASPQLSDTDLIAGIGGEERSGALTMRKIAFLITDALREDDLLYRTGPARFELVLDNLPQDNTVAIASTICEQFIRNINQSDFPSMPGSSFQIYSGIAVCPLHTEVPEQLRLYANTAVKAACYSRARTLVVFETDLEKAVRENTDKKRQLERAIDGRQFFLVFQPQHNTSTNTVIGFEALVRWNHPERGIVTPDQFIADVERFNLMDRLGMLVVDMACEFASRYLSDSAFASVCMAVNVSPTQLRTAGFRSVLKQTLQVHNIPAHCFELELTEESYINDFDAARDLLTYLRADGFGIAIDDFGSGSTSLRYLNYLPATKLKIDRSFIADITGNSKSAEITRSVIELGQKLNMQVIAEGVENINQAELVSAWGCALIQGYHYSRPLTADDALAYLRRVNLTHKESVV